MRQLIIAIDGIDGAGKTTICREIKKSLGDLCSVYSRTNKTRAIHRLLIHFPFKQAHILQIPIYLCLGRINYRIQKEELNTPIVIMDRCFLSNICYYYPSALKHFMTFKLALLFEAKLIPSKIFIIDEIAEVAQKRDNYEKSLTWLKKVRTNYLEVTKHQYARLFQMQIIPAQLPLDQKIEIIYSSIKKEMEKENGT